MLMDARFNECTRLKVKWEHLKYGEVRMHPRLHSDVHVATGCKTPGHIPFLNQLRIFLTFICE